MFPITAKIYQNSSWIDFDDVYLGTVQVSNNAITSVVHRNFNDNGHNVNRLNQRVVETTYKSGTSWYRVWSDGFVEQGGLSTGVNSKNITFLKPFSNANYVLIASIINESHYSYLPMLNNKTAKGFSYQINYGGTSNVTGDCNYYAAGF